ncbi:MAG: hypothetical protein HY293_05470 [Planctomycetes bacterium]|nr:hypothetical protein [Planctomycetota bacterium]
MAAQRRIVLWAAGGLVLAIGMLGILHAMRFDPQTVKDEAAKRIEEINTIPDDDPIRKDALVQEFLANESYKDHARAQYLKVERESPRLRDRAKLEREARAAVPPFLARCKDPTAADLPALSDEARSLHRNYATTRYGAALQELRDRLKERMERQDKVGPGDVVILQRDVRKALQDGRPAEATKLIEDFRKRPGSGEYQPQVRECEEQVRRAIKPR